MIHLINFDTYCNTINTQNIWSLAIWNYIVISITKSFMIHDGFDKRCFNNLFKKEHVYTLDEYRFIFRTQKDTIINEIDHDLMSFSVTGMTVNVGWWRVRNVGKTTWHKPAIFLGMVNIPPMKMVKPPTSHESWYGCVSKLTLLSMLPWVVHTPI